MFTETVLYVFLFVLGVASFYATFQPYATFFLLVPGCQKDGHSLCVFVRNESKPYQILLLVEIVLSLGGYAWQWTVLVFGH